MSDEYASSGVEPISSTTLPNRLQPPNQLPAPTLCLGCKVMSAWGLSFNILFLLLIAALLGFGLFQPEWLALSDCGENNTGFVYFNSAYGAGTDRECNSFDYFTVDFTNTSIVTNIPTQFCIPWQAADQWSAMAVTLGDKQNSTLEEDAENVWSTAYILMITAFASSVASLLFLLNGVCCPLNGRHRAQFASSFFMLTTFSTGVASLILISQTDTIQPSVWEDFYLLVEGPGVCDKATTKISNSAIGVIVALLLSFFISFSVVCPCTCLTCCGCCWLQDEAFYIWA